MTTVRELSSKLVDVMGIDAAAVFAKNISRRGHRMIRDATEDDIPDLLVMGQKFFDLAGWPEIAEWDDASVTATLNHLIGSADGVLLAIDHGKDGLVGMAGALLYPFYFNSAHRTGQELFWWVEPAARGREALELFDALEGRARQQGAMSFKMGTVEGLRSATLERYYRRRGYRASENTFIRSFP